ncbi:MAG: hypothetical protein JWP12_814 [Bacteroidetes bacterium]|nr:hypothetical protein [Bacteroidota bacterium]
MKKILLSLSVIAAFATGAKAQAPDFGFENWTTVPFSTAQDPNGWASLNVLTIAGTPQSVFKETALPIAGTASARIKTVKVTGATIPNPYGGTLDTAGILAIGKINISPPGIIYGYTYVNRPAVLTFKALYAPSGLDSAFVIAYMTHWNTTLNKRDTIGTGKFATGALGVATTCSLSMAYKPAFSSVMADSEQIFISSSIYRSHHGAQLNSEFTVDDFAWSGYVSTNDIEGVQNSVSVYPNPATNKITLECSVTAKMVEVTDLTGRKVGTYMMNNNKVEVETSGYSNGIYMYNVYDTHGVSLNRGKFQVSN